MGKINILDASVFNMLAAGEVVERPASVVKELVENSIDAGATVIDISVREGGTRLIEVSDNGIGISKEDMRAAFLPHATSKISKIIDLDSLSTLGFRGEALASIASVSEVTMTSAQRGADMGAKIVLSGGRVTYEGAASANVGTVICVENLFFNTPARLKFLKKPSLELKYIEETVRRLVLANPELSISLTADGESLLFHSGGTLFDAVAAVYGAKIADGLIEVSEERNGIRVTGYVSAPENSKATRAYQTIIVNGRAVEDVTVQTAAEKAYGDLLMKRNFPVSVLNILLPFDQVDVNVHPSKTEVRFADRQGIFGAVYHAVYDAVHKMSSTVAPIKNDEKQDDEQGRNAARNVIQPRIDSRYFSAPPRHTFREGAIPAYTSSKSHKYASDFGVTRYDDIEYGVSYAPEAQKYGSEGVNQAALAEEKAADNGFDVSKYGGSEKYGDNDGDPVFDGKIIGQLFATYLVVERDDIVYIIDQHAAHERILYDKIRKRTVSEYTQPLLVPYTLNLSGEETERLETILVPLKEIGFDIVLRGAHYVIEGVPEPVSHLNLRDFFSNILAEDIVESVSLADIMRDKLAQTACKAAIKGGENLNREQIERVLATLTSEDGQLPEKCPHGRPAVITLTKTDLEKLFKRIV